MALKARIKALSEVPEALQSFYTEKDGEFVLGVEGMVTSDKLNEFRDNNIALKKQMDDLNAKFAGVDPEKFKALSDKEQKERDKKLIDAGKVDELVAERVNAMKADHDKQLKTLTDERAKLSGQLEGLVIDNAIRDAATKSGVRATAVDDVLLRGRMLFKLKDGKAVPMEGDKPVFGKDGNEMGINEWVGGLAERAPHLFETSSGAGSGGSSQSAPGGKISRTDQKSFLNNLDKIAKGEQSVA